MMQFLGYDNWISYGWGLDQSDTFNLNPLYIKIKKDLPIESQPTAIEAAKNTINLITKKYPPPYTLMCSGGVDSQAMLWAWQQSGQKFNVLSVRFKSNGIWFNEHDLLALEQFSTLHNIQGINYIDFDVIDFLETDSPEVSKLYNCPSPQICTHIKMSEAINKGTIIFGGNFASEQIKPTIGTNQLGLQRYAVATNNESRKVIPFFFLLTQELANSFKPDSSFDMKRETSYGVKCHLYCHNGFPIVPQETQINGFERIKEYYDQFGDRVPRLSRLKYADMSSFRPFDLLFRYPLGINKYIHKEKIIVITEP